MHDMQLHMYMDMDMDMDMCMCVCMCMCMYTDVECARTPHAAHAHGYGRVPVWRLTLVCQMRGHH